MAHKKEKPPKKKQEKAIVQLQETIGTFGGVPGKPLGKPSTFETDAQGRPIREVAIGQESGIVQDIAGGTAPQDITQLSLEQQAQLGDVNAQKQLRLLHQIQKENVVLNRDLSSRDNLPLPQPQTPVIGQINGAVSETIEQPGALTSVDRSFRETLGLPARTPEEEAIRESLAVPALGLVGGALFAGAVRAADAKNSLRLPNEATHFLNKIFSLGKARPVRVPSAGRIPTNTRSSGLLRRVFRVIFGNKGLNLLSSVILLDRIADTYTSSENTFISTMDKLNTEINSINEALIGEEDPQVIEAYRQENERLLALKKEVSNPDAWEQIRLTLPFFNQGVRNAERAKVETELLESQQKKFDAAIKKKIKILETANIFRQLDPELREAIMEEAQLQKQSESIAEALI